MSDVYVYNLENYLPLYLVKKDSLYHLRNGSEVLIGTFQSTLTSDLEKAEKENIYLNNANNELEECPKWVSKQIASGILGELIMCAYLKRHYKVVEHVSPIDSSLGYDIKVTDNGKEMAFEVKTTTQNSGKLYITYNELNIANKMKDTYNIFYLVINKSKKSVKGYLINNPIKSLGINLEKLIRIEEYKNIIVAPNSFIVQFKENFFEDLVPIQLERFVNLI